MWFKPGYASDFRHLRHLLDQLKAIKFKSCKQQHCIKKQINDHESNLKAVTFCSKMCECYYFSINTYVCYYLLNDPKNFFSVLHTICNFLVNVEGSFNKDWVIMTESFQKRQNSCVFQNLTGLFYIVLFFCCVDQNLNN